MKTDGFLIIDKPVGLRSTRCVEIVRDLLGRKPAKIGHGGTLDSTASGVLVILVGGATRLSNFVMGLPKKYVADVQLGFETSTDDASGETILSLSRDSVNDSSVDSVIPAFLGWRLQSPPKVSAVHVNGKRAHELAREGESFVPSAKPIYIKSIEGISGISSDGRFKISVECSKGTYIRSLVRDMGRRLGTAAHVCGLRRCYVGCFDLNSAIDGAKLETTSRDELLNSVIPLSYINNAAAHYFTNDETEKRIINGQTVDMTRLIRTNFERFNISDKFDAIISTEKLTSLCKAEDKDNTFVMRPVANLLNGEIKR